jgi:hypothetical protein
MMLKDWIWDKLFLDFYLDKRWTWRFKLMNLISGDALREYLSSAQQNLQEGIEGKPGSYTYFKRAAYWTNCAWELWRNEL